MSTPAAAATFVNESAVPAKEACRNDLRDKSSEGFAIAAECITQRSGTATPATAGLKARPSECSARLSFQAGTFAPSTCPPEKKGGRYNCVPIHSGGGRPGA